MSAGDATESAKFCTQARKRRAGAGMLPATVELPTDVVLDVIAEMLSLIDQLIAFNGGQCTPTSGVLDEATATLFHALAPNPPYEYDMRAPLVVEAYARAEEHSADVWRHYEGRALESLERAAEIRRVGHPFLTEEEVAAKIRSGLMSS